MGKTSTPEPFWTDKKAAAYFEEFMDLQLALRGGLAEFGIRNSGLERRLMTAIADQIKAGRFQGILSSLMPKGRRGAPDKKHITKALKLELSGRTREQIYSELGLITEKEKKNLHTRLLNGVA